MYSQLLKLGIPHSCPGVQGYGTFGMDDIVLLSILFGVASWMVWHRLEKGHGNQ